MSIGNWYRVGTVSVQNGNVNIVGTNTFWTTQCNPGDRFTVDGENWYEIITITDDTHLSIESVGGSGAFAGATAANLPYAVDRNFNNALSGGLAAQVAALLAQFQAGANGPLSGLFQNGSAATPGIAFLNEASTGLFRPAAGIAALAVQGAEFLRAVGTVNGVPAMLGLGTAAPAQMVDLAGSNSALWGVRMTNGSVGTGARSGFIASNGTQNLNIGVNGANFTANGVLAPSRGFVEGPAGIDFASGVTAGNAFSWGVGAGYASKMAMDFQGNVTMTGGAVTFADGATWGAAGLSSTAAISTAVSNASYQAVTPAISTTAASGTQLWQTVLSSPTWNSSATTGSGNFYSFAAGIALPTTFTKAGTANYIGYSVHAPANSSSVFFDQITAYNCAAFSNGGNTAGTVSNYSFNGAGHTAAAAAGGTLNNYGFNITIGTGSGAGTTTNTGLSIIGNGGSGGSGTTNNWAINSTSTANSALAGKLFLGYTTSNGSYPLQVNGQIFATSSSIATSDQMFKTNVAPIKTALSLINSLNPVEFDFLPNETHNFPAGRQIGFIAQQVQAALAGTDYANAIVFQNNRPAVLAQDAVSEVIDEETGNVIVVASPAVPAQPVESFLGVADAGFTPLLVKAIQELTLQATALQETVAALQAKAASA